MQQHQRRAFTPAVPDDFAVLIGGLDPLRRRLDPPNELGRRYPRELPVDNRVQFLNAPAAPLSRYRSNLWRRGEQVNGISLNSGGGLSGRCCISPALYPLPPVYLV